MMTKMVAPAAAAAALVVLGAWGSSAQRPDAHGAMAQGKVAGAVCVLTPTSKSGGNARGTIYFTPQGDGMRVHGTIEGIAPGDHGFHVHEFGDLTKDDATAAGGHFNPTGAPHAGPNASRRHVGDLGNIKANGRGVAVVDLVDDQIRLSGPHSILGRGLVVHAKADDLRTPPSGNAGDRVAVGVIGVMGTEPAKDAAKKKEAAAKRR